MKLKIETDVPIPFDHQRAAVESPLNEMRPGDSFAVPLESATTLLQDALNYMRILGGLWCVRPRDENGEAVARIWKVA